MSIQTGIWIDQEKAHIIHLKDGTETMQTVHSDADFRERYAGEESDDSRMGQQAITHDRSKEKRLEQQLKAYYDELKEVLKDSKELYIFGPAEAKKELQKELENDNQFKAELRAVESADSMTENQMKARVREFFSTNK